MIAPIHNMLALINPVAGEQTAALSSEADIAVCEKNQDSLKFQALEA